MWLPYEYAFEMAVGLLALYLMLRYINRENDMRNVRIVVSVTQELIVLLTLYGLWQYIHELAVTKTAGAIENARRLWDFQRWLHLPSEVTLEHWFINNKPVMWFLNIYYGGVHVPAAGMLLIWVFWRHRDRYAGVRATFVLTIAGCLTVQALVPMAPPRFLTDLGFVDAAIKYHLSVYGTGGQGISNEVAAMPSFHVGWALLVGVAVVAISTSKWRWLALLHPFLTIMSVTITANHWWLDGVVAGIILAISYVVQHQARLWFKRLRQRWRPDDDLEPPTEAVPELSQVS